FADALLPAAFGLESGGPVSASGVSSACAVAARANAEPIGAAWTGLFAARSADSRGVPATGGEPFDGVSGVLASAFAFALAGAISAGFGAGDDVRTGASATAAASSSSPEMGGALFVCAGVLSAALSDIVGASNAARSGAFAAIV